LLQARLFAGEEKVRLAARLFQIGGGACGVAGRGGDDSGVQPEARVPGSFA
jgi:hypothetical protein